MSVPATTPGTIGAIIRARRHVLGWDQATLAAKINVSRLWISQVENGKPGASLGLVLNALAALGMELAVVTNDSENVSNQTTSQDIQTPDLAAILAKARGQSAP